jgi:hypothetical protein
VERELGIDARIERGQRAEFTVWSDGDLLFSKADEDRFPEPAEIVEKLRA